MPNQPDQKPVGDDVPRVDDAVAVGENLDFQRQWWRFEKVIWIFFTLILVADLAGLLGRGPLANAERQTGDGSLRVKYERVLRENTSSIITILPVVTAIHNGTFQLFVSDSLIRELGAQRIIPQPQTSVLGNGGVTYSFPASSPPITVQFELKPSFIGTHSFTVAVPGGEALQAKSLVLP